MPKVVDIFDCDGISIPMSATGRLLDWRGWKPGMEEAPALTSSWGMYHFRIGTLNHLYVPDYAFIPDGRMAINVIEPGPGPSLHIEDVYNLKEREEAFESVYYLTLKILQALEREGLTHDTKTFGADQWHFARAVGRETGIKPFTDMVLADLLIGDDVW